MSTLMDTIISDLQFETTLKSGLGMGNIVIKGITIPKASNGIQSHEPLIDIWCAVRKKAARKWHISVAAYFTYIEDGVACTLCLSTANLYGDALIEELGHFEKHFYDIAELFELTLEEWIIDEKCGYLTYLRYATVSNSDFDPEIGHAIMARFLYCIGLKLPDAHHDRKLKKRVRTARRRAK